MKLNLRVRRLELQGRHERAICVEMCGRVKLCLSAQTVPEANAIFQGAE
jgi:hypothetical protein